MTTNPYINKITLIQGNIAEQDVDAIISLIPKNLEYRGSVNASLLAAAGERLDDFIAEQIYQPKAGDVYAVPGFNLKAKNMIFAVRPVWKDDWDRREKDVLSCCRKAMVLAKCMLLSCIAFPPLASGKNGFPPERAARLIVQGITDRLDERMEEVRIVVPDTENYKIYYTQLLRVGWQGS